MASMRLLSSFRVYPGIHPAFYGGTIQTIDWVEKLDLLTCFRFLSRLHCSDVLISDKYIMRIKTDIRSVRERSGFKTLKLYPVGKTYH